MAVSSKSAQIIAFHISLLILVGNASKVGIQAFRNRAINLNIIQDVDGKPLLLSPGDGEEILEIEIIEDLPETNADTTDSPATTDGMDPATDAETEGDVSTTTVSTTATATDKAEPPPDDGLDPGVIAAIVISVIVGVAIIVTVSVVCYKRKRSSASIH